MFGFLFGLACLGGLYFYFNGGWGRHTSGSDRPVGGWRRRVMLRRLFSRLQTTPGQERVIQDALNDLEQEAGTFRNGLSGLGQTLSGVVREEELVAERIDGLLAEQEQSLEGVRGAMAKALSQIHAVLDREQRARLADWLQSMATRRHHGHGHGHGHGHCGLGRGAWQ